jgi:hypothetical protein
MKNFLTALVSFCVFFPFSSKADIVLSKDGKGLYSIYSAPSAGHIDRFALNELKLHLKKISGADFSSGISGKTIYLGLSNEAKKLLGKDDLSSKLKDQESVIQTKGGNLFLYGSGSHGNLYAVYELLENKLGCRWLNAYGDAFIPQTKTIILKEGTTRTRYSYATRALMNYFYPDRAEAFFYNYRNRQNNLLRHTPEFHSDNPGIVQKVPVSGSSHVLSRVIPGFSGKWINPPEKWIKTQNYFKIHPEWFSMDEKGKRVNNRQLCFSNPKLRRELEKNLMEFHRRDEKKRGRAYLMFDLNDIAYNICCCPDCQALQKKYKSPGAPFFTCLFEFCKKYPETEFLTLAYQRSLTQTAPVGMTGKIKNLTVIFAPINGDYAGTLKQQNKRDYDDLKNWRSIAKDIWVWYYPNTYPASKVDLPVLPPVGNFERLAEDIRAIHEAGVDGSYFEHDSGGIQLGANLSEMQSYVMYKLFENVNRDVWSLVRDFAVCYYGKAAPEVIRFARELEDCRKSAVKRKITWWYNTQDYDYLTDKNLLSWNALLTQAAAKVKGEEAFRINQLRMGLDCVIIWKLWDKKQDALLKECSDRLIRTAAELKRRNRPSSAKLQQKIENWLKKMFSRGKDKPLPAEFAKLSADNIIVVLPPEGGKKQYNANDPDANRNFAKMEPWNGKYLSVGTYDWRSKKYGPGRRIYPKEIKKGQYALYKISDNVILTPSLGLWAGQWNLTLPLGKFCRHDDLKSLTRKWTLYVSLKFTDDKVYLDRGFLADFK